MCLKYEYIAYRHQAKQSSHKETKGMSEEGTMANNKVEKINTEEKLPIPTILTPEKFFEFKEEV